jgi:D-ornithine 4,5-aminomutase subunit alpha
MGFTSAEAAALVKAIAGRGLLRHGAGRLVLELAATKGITVRAAGEALLAGRHWEALAP